MEIPPSEKKNSYLEYFKLLSNINNKGRKKNSEGLDTDQKRGLLMPTEEKYLSPDKSLKNKSNKSDSNKKGKKDKGYKSKIKSKKGSLPMTPVDEEIKKNIEFIHSENTMNETMKKTLEENNKERDINLPEDVDTNRFDNPQYKYASAPVSNKNSDMHESIFSNTMKLAAFRASEVKKRNKDMVMKYGEPEMLRSSRCELDFIKKLHGAALTIQN